MTLNLYYGYIDDEAYCVFAWANSVKEAKPIIYRELSNFEDIEYTELNVRRYRYEHRLDLPDKPKIVDGHNWCSECSYILPADWPMAKGIYYPDVCQDCENKSKEPAA